MRRSKALAWALYLSATACLLGSAAAPHLLIPRAIEMPWTCSKRMVFPRLAERAHIQGTVVLRFQVQPGGSIERIEVRQSTQARRNARKEQVANPRSQRSLDIARQFERAAIDSVASCHFPAMPGYGPASAEVPIEFRFPKNT